MTTGRVLRWCGTVIVILLLGALVYGWWTRPGPMSPVVFLHATLLSNTGGFENDMTVVVKDGRVLFVGDASATVPSVGGARRVDTLGAWLAAATFDPSAETPIQGLKHLWVGQLYAGAPGDVVLTTVPSRGRGGGGGGAIGDPSGRQIFGAIAKGRYYSGRELK